MSKTVSKFALAASVALALAFTLSCSSGDGDSGSWNWDGTFSSSVILSSSSLSSAVPSSSSVGGGCVGFDPEAEIEHYGTMKKQFCDERDGKKYAYVNIGTQIWMAENLNYNATGSRCYGDSESNCVKYGKLYNWATAMNNSESSIAVPSGVQGICPSGWHLPSPAEWLVMTTHIGGADTEGKKLKATSGWNDYSDVSGSGPGNGTDDYGFSALPGGWWNGSFSHIGYRGFWWSTRSITFSAGENHGSFKGIHYNSEGASWVSNPQSYLMSVRCLKDYTPSSSSSSSGDQSSSSVGNSSSSSAPNSSSSVLPPPSSSSLTPSVVYGDPVTYGDEIYQTVVIGNQTWFARNLNYEVEGSKCYNDEPSNCETYGRLYDWATAMSLPSNCNSTSCLSQIQPKHRGICPTGWHIPSNADWDKLSRFVDGTSGMSSPYESSTAGRYLKASTGWEPYSSIENLDIYGFSALPGGRGNTDDGSFDDVGRIGRWWSSTESSLRSGAYRRVMHYSNWSADWLDGGKSSLISVRCIQD